MADSTPFDDSDDPLLSYVAAALLTNGGFTLIPPDEIGRNPSLLECADVLHRFGGSSWQITFRHGGGGTLIFRYLLLMLYNFNRIAKQLRQVDRRDQNKISSALLFHLTNDLVTAITTEDARAVIRDVLMPNLQKGKDG